MTKGNVFAYQAIGYYTVPMVRFVFASIEKYESGSPGALHIFADFSELQSYDSKVRIEATDWFRRRGERTATFHALMQSKLVAMGVTTMGLIANLPIRAYSGRTQFELERERIAKL